jgi:FkbM family methyltransferase
MNIYFKESYYGNFCLVEDDLISNCINTSGAWEPHLFHFYKEFIKPGYTIIDGGANIGFHAVQFAKLSTPGLVYCFEPQPLIFNVLSTNSLINGCSDVIKQFRLGLGDFHNQKLKMTPLKEQIFSEHCINYGGRGLTDDVDGEESVQLTTIDYLQLQKLDLIKLDVQGFELNTLRGGEKTIKSTLPLMFIENYPDSDKDKLVIDLLKSWGYEIYRLQCSHNEDCIAVIPNKHLEEISYIESQTEIQWIK